MKKVVTSIAAAIPAKEAFFIHQVVRTFHSRIVNDVCRYTDLFLVMVPFFVIASSSNSMGTKAISNNRPEPHSYQPEDSSMAEVRMKMKRLIFFITKKFFVKAIVERF